MMNSVFNFKIIEIITNVFMNFEHKIICDFFDFDEFFKNLISDAYKKLHLLTTLVY